MKCDELKSLWVYSRDIEENCDEEFVNFAKENGYEELVEKKEVIEAIAELKEKCEAEKSIGATFSKNGAELARWVEELRVENRKLKRALWLSRAKIAKAMKSIDNLDNYLSLHKNSKWFGIYATRIDTWYYKWDNVERKCLKKAEEYK